MHPNLMVSLSNHTGSSGDCRYTNTMPNTPRIVVLRDERDGANRRYLCAYLDLAGLHIDGQDLGPSTALVSEDGEYEWFETIASADLPRLVALLGGASGEDVLDLLERDWTADGRSYELEARLRESDIPVQRSVWS
jgi:hypothetical protein